MTPMTQLYIHPQKAATLHSIALSGLGQQQSCCCSGGDSTLCMHDLLTPDRCDRICAVAAWHMSLLQGVRLLLCHGWGGFFLKWGKAVAFEHMTLAVVCCAGAELLLSSAWQCVLFCNEQPE